MLRSTPSRYGAVAVTLHWLVAAVVFGNFALGLWMVDLTYYDAWYRRAPAIHKGVGVLLFVVVGLRLGWRLSDFRPDAEPRHARWERAVARFVQALLYALLFAVMVSGYLISTADGRPLDVFGLFRVPATLSGLEGQADVAGVVHLWLATSLVCLAGLHGLAALKHHFVDGDGTLMKMLGRERRRPGDVCR